MSSTNMPDGLPEDLGQLPENLKQRVLKKFLKIRAATLASHLQHQQATTAHSRRKADRYLDEMLPGQPGEASDLGDIIIADDITLSTGKEPVEEQPGVEKTAAVAAVSAPVDSPTPQKSWLSTVARYGLALALGGLGGGGLSIAMGLLSPPPPAAVPSPPSVDTDTNLEPYIPVSSKKK